MEHCMTYEELKQLERPLEHVLKWLSGRSISPTILRYEINECGTSVKRLMIERLADAVQ